MENRWFYGTSWRLRFTVECVLIIARWTKLQFSQGTGSPLRCVHISGLFFPLFFHLFFFSFFTPLWWYSCFHYSSLVNDQHGLLSDDPDFGRRMFAGDLTPRRTVVQNVFHRFEKLESLAQRTEFCNGISNEIIGNQTPCYRLLLVKECRFLPEN